MQLGVTFATFATDTDAFSNFDMGTGTDADTIAIGANSFSGSTFGTANSLLCKLSIYLSIYQAIYLSICLHNIILPSLLPFMSTLSN